MHHSIQWGVRVEIIADDQVHRIVPSWVSFTDDKRLGGDSAKNVYYSNSASIVFNAKRLIGHMMDEADLEERYEAPALRHSEQRRRETFHRCFVKGEKPQFVNWKYVVFRLQ